MKIKHHCTICNNYEIEDLISVKSIPKDFVIRTNCNKGHNQNIILMNPLYTILYDNSIIAYQQQNYRSCVFEASSALERFFEHAIRILIIPNKDIGNLEKIQQYESAWKLIKNMSERQLGAFIMLFNKTTNQIPILLTEKLISLRNNTIHKGHTPTENEALVFMTNVYDVIQKNRIIIRKYDEDAFWLLDQRVDSENMTNSNDIPEETISYSGPHFFNSSFGFDFLDSINRYYKKCLDL